MNIKVFYCTLGGIIIIAEILFTIYLCIVKLKDQPEDRIRVILRMMMSMLAVAGVVAYICITN